MRCATASARCLLPAAAPTVEGFSQRFEAYRRTIEPTLAFLQGRDPTLMHRIAGRGFLPEGPRFRSLDAYVG